MGDCPLPLLHLLRPGPAHRAPLLAATSLAVLLLAPSVRAETEADCGAAIDQLKASMAGAADATKRAAGQASLRGAEREREDGDFAACVAATREGGASMASAEFQPNVTGNLTLEIQNDATYRRRGGRTTNDLYTDTEFEMQVNLAPIFSIVSHLHIEPVRDPPDGNRFFSGEGFYMEELYANFEWNKRGGFKLGKFDPKFGSAFDEGVGIYGTDAAEDTYELDEGMGISPFMQFDGGLAGDTTITASVFKFDNTWLSNSAITSPAFDADRTSRVGRNRVRYGGPGNTAYPTSAALAVEGEKLFRIDGLKYNLGFQRLARGRVQGDTSQYGTVAGLIYEGAINESWEIKTIAEAAFLRHAEGTRHDNFIPTLGVQATYEGAWRLFASYAQFRRQATATAQAAVFDGTGAPTGETEDRDIRQSALDRIYSAGVGYSFEFAKDTKLDLDLAWVRKTSSNDGFDRELLRDGVGFRLHYEWKF